MRIGQPSISLLSCCGLLCRCPQHVSESGSANQAFSPPLPFPHNKNQIRDLVQCLQHVRPEPSRRIGAYHATITCDRIYLQKRLLRLAPWRGPKVNSGSWYPLFMVNARKARHRIFGYLKCLYGPWGFIVDRPSRAAPRGGPHPPLAGCG